MFAVHLANPITISDLLKQVMSMDGALNQSDTGPISTWRMSTSSGPGKGFEYTGKIVASDTFLDLRAVRLANPKKHHHF